MIMKVSISLDELKEIVRKYLANQGIKVGEIVAMYHDDDFSGLESDIFNLTLK